MTVRLSSGHAHLDRLLGGGLPASAINLIIGAPGSGKTILAQQYVFHNASVERPALYLTTVSEPLDKLLRYGQSLEFFDVARIGRDVIYDDLGTALHAEGLDGALTRIIELIKEHRPGVLVIDSFKALRAYAPDDRSFRGFLHDLAGRSSVLAMASFWIGEYDRDDTSEAAEFAVADAIIALGTRRTATREFRVLQVLKLRGSDFQSGQHSYRIRADGLHVFPRLADPIDPSDYTFDQQRVSTGIAALDEALADGYWPGSSTLVAGPSGCGKTVTGLHFVVEGARQGEPGLFATLQENASQLGRLAAGFGWDLDAEGFHLMARSPVDLYINEWIYDLLEHAERIGARRIVIDSLGDLILASGDELGLREFLYSLLQRCSRANISLMLTLELQELFTVSRLADMGIAHLSDNVLLLQYLRAESQIIRAMTVLKTRASHHHPAIREFHITADGITLGDPVEKTQHFA